MISSRKLSVAIACISPAPDGYTLLMAGLSFAVNVGLFAKLNFDPIKDFETVSLVATVPLVVVVHVPYKGGGPALAEIDKWTKVSRAAGLRASD